ncbi:YqaA family protein [Qingshengfaniella alkalisoli]|uniref:YqaA family protein n=1 Tax=Qingshengfaniella alkalisoli TaxID=2599296 RepID=UPI0030840CE4
MAFGAATILPFQSEVLFVALQLQASLSVLALIIAASIGNIAGSGVNYALGLALEHFKDRRWFPVTETQLARAQRWYSRYGVWTLLLSWAPFGDALTVVAGVMRTRPAVFLALVSTAKIGRYIILAWLTAAVAG